ncbi:MAG: DUF393 domain-containing protein [Gammaproteobacteria bacterium]|nr:DUF393 domain-containing protein [Gammaproteobacteria bacterium]
MPSQITHQFYLIYDSRCPLCVTELKHLKKRDKKGKLILIDIHSEQFKSDFPDLPKQKALEKLHGFYYIDSDSEQQIEKNKQWYFGLDATYHAWRAVGLGFVIKPLRWPLIRYVFDAMYRFFAQHRGRIAKLVTGKSECLECDISFTRDKERVSSMKNNGQLK